MDLHFEAGDGKKREAPTSWTFIPTKVAKDKKEDETEHKLVRIVGLRAKEAENI